MWRIKTKRYEKINTSYWGHVYTKNSAYHHNYMLNSIIKLGGLFSMQSM